MSLSDIEYDDVFTRTNVNRWFQDYIFAVGSGREPTESFASLIDNVQSKVNSTIQSKDLSISGLQLQHQEELSKLKLHHSDELSKLKLQNSEESNTVNVKVAQLTGLVESEREKAQSSISRLQLQHQEELSKLKLQNSEESNTLNVRVAQLTEIVESGREQVKDLQRQLYQQMRLEVYTMNELKRHGELYHGVKTPSELWDEVRRDRNKFKHKELLSSLTPLNHPDIASLQRLVFTAEENMYAPVTRCLAKLFGDTTLFRQYGAQLQVRVFDTHNNTKFLGNRAPDIAICTPMINNPNAIYVKALLELKHPDVSITGEVFGQAYDYLLRVADAQPNRNTFTVLVSNIQKNHFITIVRDDGGDFTVSHHGPVSFPVALAHLGTVLKDPAQQPDNPSFTSNLGAVDNILGVTFDNLVAEFKFSEASLNRALRTPNLIRGNALIQLPCSVAVKRCRANRPVLQSEIEMLQRITPTTTLPQLVFHSSDFNEFGYVPVGRRCTPATLVRSQHLARTALNDILKAITWLHKNNIIHRDIRWGNIILSDGHAVVIDFNCSIVLSAQGSADKVLYKGGFICCPPRLLDNITQPYTPKRADDYHAYLLLVNELLFPASIKGFHSQAVISPESPENIRLRQLWEALEASKYWGPFVTAAQHEDINTLQELKEAVVMLNTQPLYADIRNVYDTGEGEVQVDAVEDLADRVGELSTTSGRMLPECDEE